MVFAPVSGMSLSRFVQRNGSIEGLEMKGGRRCWQLSISNRADRGDCREDYPC